MARIWFRVGMEAEVTDEELEILKRTKFASGILMQEIIERAELSGETYIVGKNCGGVDDYDNPDEEISFEF